MGALYLIALVQAEPDPDRFSPVAVRVGLDVGDDRVLTDGVADPVESVLGNGAVSVELSWTAATLEIRASPWDERDVTGGMPELASLLNSTNPFESTASLHGRWQPLLGGRAGPSGWAALSRARFEDTAFGLMHMERAQGLWVYAAGLPFRVEFAEPVASIGTIRVGAQAGPSLRGMLPSEFSALAVSQAVDNGDRVARPTGPFIGGQVDAWIGLGDGVTLWGQISAHPMGTSADSMRDLAQVQVVGGVRISAGKTFSRSEPEEE